VCNDPDHGFCLLTSLSKPALEDASGWDEENGEGKICYYSIE